MKYLKYYILEGSFLENYPKGAELKSAIEAHHKYLEPYFKSGSILMSGPKAGAGGGVIVIKCEDNSDINQFCKDDPFVKAGIQEYNVIEFKLFGCQELVKNWFE